MIDLMAAGRAVCTAVVGVLWWAMHLLQTAALCNFFSDATGACCGGGRACLGHGGGSTPRGHGGDRSVEQSPLHRLAG